MAKVTAPFVAVMHGIYESEKRTYQFNSEEEVREWVKGVKPNPLAHTYFFKEKRKGIYTKVDYMFKEDCKK